MIQMTIEKQMPSNNASLETRLADLEARVRIMEDKAKLTDLLNYYARTLDLATSDPSYWPNWESCFTEDCTAEYPYGRHEGREGLSAWVSSYHAPIHAFQHLSSNFEIEIDGDTARARTNLFCACVFNADNPRDYFAEGGPYEWEFRRTAEGWKIKSVHLTVVWIAGNDEAAIGPDSL